MKMGSYDQRIHFILFTFYTLELVFALVAIYYKWLRVVHAGQNIIGAWE